VSSWIIFAAIGKILIFIWSKFPLPEKLQRNKKIEQLHNCGLCSGVWIFTLLAYFVNIDILNLWFGFEHVAFVGEFITGCLTSYIVHLLSVGFVEQHMNIVVN